MQDQIEQLRPWYHSIDLGNGIVTPGKGSARSKFEALEPHLPDSLGGVTVLDLGCNAGGVSVEFARRGADVVGVEATAHYHRQAVWVRDTLQLSNFEPVHMPVYEIGSLDREFDIVLFLGLVYHLRHPQLAFDVIAPLCKKHLFVTTPAVFTDAAIMESRLPATLVGEGGPAIPPTDEAKYNWWFPSGSALRAMLRASGFHNVAILKSSGGGFRSSSPEADNTSAFETGNILLQAERFAADQTNADVHVLLSGDAAAHHAEPTTASERFSELELMLHYLREPTGSSVMLDVGAHIGRFSEAFADKGWRCIAFEPDPENFAELKGTLAQHPESMAIQKAVAETTKSGVTFFRSTEFWGIHSLHPFDPSHREQITVDTTRLDDVLKGLGVDGVDVLKIDAEGADFAALQSIDIDTFRPRLVVVEFSDERTRPLGHDHHDIVKYMARYGYAAWISEWAPIVSHSRKGGGGGPFNFIRCSPYPVVHEPAWGNLLFVPESERAAFDHAVAEYSALVSAAQQAASAHADMLGRTLHERTERLDRLQQAVDACEEARLKLQRRVRRQAGRIAKMKQEQSARHSSMAQRVRARIKRFL